MEKARGIVIKVGNDELIYLVTPEGKFVKGKAQSTRARLGEEAEVVVCSSEKTAAKTSLSAGIKKIIAAAAAVLIFFTLLNVFPNISPVKSSAYLSLDINPSMEFAIDKENTVTHVEPLNEEAYHILNGLSWEGEHITASLEKVFEKAEKLQYISSEKDNIIQITFAAEEKQKDTAEEIEAVIKNHMENNNIPAYYKIRQADLKDREKAQEENISLNQLSLKKELHDIGVKLKEEDAKVPPGQIVREHKHDEIIEKLKFKQSGTAPKGPPEGVPKEKEKPRPPEDVPGEKEKPGPPEDVPGKKEESGPPEDVPEKEKPGPSQNRNENN